MVRREEFEGRPRIVTPEKTTQYGGTKKRKMMDSFKKRDDFFSLNGGRTIFCWVDGAGISVFLFVCFFAGKSVCVCFLNDAKILLDDLERKSEGRKKYVLQFFDGDFWLW